MVGEITDSSFNGWGNNGFESRNKKQQANGHHTKYISDNKTTQ